MTKRFKMIMVAIAIMFTSIGIGTVSTAPVQAASPVSCTLQYYPNPNGGARARCVNSSNPLQAYRVEIQCTNGLWYYGSPQVYPTWSSKYCPYGKNVYTARAFAYPS